MKIKSIGTITSEPIKETKRGYSSNKALIFTGISIITLVVLLIYYFFIYSKKSEELTREQITILSQQNQVPPQNIPMQQETPQINSGQNTYDPKIEAAVKVREWIIALGNRNFDKAYNMMTVKRRGDYSRFCSTKGYGGITRTNIFSCYAEYYEECFAKVIADYESFDPANRDGRFKQEFTIDNCEGKWEISDIKTLEKNFY